MARHNQLSWEEKNPSVYTYEKIDISKYLDLEADMSDELREKVAKEVGDGDPDYWRADRILGLLVGSGWKSPKEVEEAIKQEREKILNWIKENYPLS